MRNAPRTLAEELPFDFFDLSPEEVATRFREARRRGTPAWLWPEVSEQARDEALDSIHAAVGKLLSGSLGASLTGDAGAMGVAGYTSGMGPLLGYWIETGELTADPEVAALFRLHLWHNRLRTGRLARSAEKLVRRMVCCGTAPILMKGIHTAYAYYPDPAARVMSDIDVVVAPADVTAAEHALRELGYTCVIARRPPVARSTWQREGQPSVPRSLMLTHAEDPYSVDLHISFDREFFGVGRAELDRVPHVAERHPEEGMGGVGGRVPGQPLSTLLLACHASQGLRNLSLLRLVELVFVVRRDCARSVLDWDELREAAKIAGALRFAYPALELAERLAPGTIPEAALAPFRKAATRRMRRVLERLGPGRAQRLYAFSLEGRLMWAASPRDLARMIGHSIWPARSGYSLRQLSPIYRQYFWRLMRGTIGR